MVSPQHLSHLGSPAVTTWSSPARGGDPAIHDDCESGSSDEVEANPGRHGSPKQERCGLGRADMQLLLRNMPDHLLMYTYKVQLVATDQSAGRPLEPRWTYVLRLGSMVAGAV
jgi:hypothetical protein